MPDSCPTQLTETGTNHGFGSTRRKSVILNFCQTHIESACAIIYEPEIQMAIRSDLLLRES